MTNLPRPPAHIAVYVEILGHEGAIRFLLEFGGAELNLFANPTSKSRIVQAIGLEKAKEMADAQARMSRRVPLAKSWIAAVWRTQGLSVAEIARRLHVSDVTVRTYIKKPVEGSATPPNQLRLF